VADQTTLAEREGALREQLALVEAAVTDLLAWGQTEYQTAFTAARTETSSVFRSRRYGRAETYRAVFARLCKNLGLPEPDWDALATGIVKATGPGGGDRG
jgi:hypothetical protein